MTAASYLAPALACALAHEQRRHNPLPPLGDLADEAIAIVLEAEARRAAERVTEGGSDD